MNRLSEKDRERLEFLSDREKSGSETSYCVKLLYDYVVKDNCQVILELGVCSGVSTRALLLGCRVTGGHLWSVDKDSCWVPNVHKAKNTKYRLGKSWGLEDSWTFTKQNDLEYEWNTPIDLLFIDTCHLYEHTLAELNKYCPYIKYTKHILLHDTLLDGYPTDVANGVFGVLKATKKFLSENPDWGFYETGVKCGLGVLTKYYPNPMAWLFGDEI